MSRWEFILALQGEDLRARLRKSHRNRVNRGIREGLVVRRGTSAAERDAHLTAVFGSRRRRRRRGESVGGESDPAYFHAFAETGSGEYFQAVSPEGNVLSSILVLRAPAGAYTHSSGTTAEGMERSAAHFLRFTMSEMLRREGLEILYMGGVSDPSGGLAEYKRGFGAEVRELEKVRCYVGSAVRRKVSTLVTMLREDPSEIPRTLLGRIEHSVVFVVDTAELGSPPEPEPGWVFRYIPLEDLLALQGRDDELGAYAGRFRGRRFSEAWGVFVDGELAHVNWLISAENDRTLPLRNVRLRPGESELTHGFTLPRFRGRGICPFAIASLLQVARERGDRRVFSIAGVSNSSSHRAIQKGGLRRCGDIYRWVLDWIPGQPYVTVRGHRLGQCRGRRVGRATRGPPP